MKKILISILSILFLVSFGIRIWYVNKNVDIPPIHTFNIGEEVAIEKDIFLDDFENMNGYSITVNNAEMMTYGEFLSKYRYEEKEDSLLFEENDMNYPEMVYDLHLTIKNTNKTDNPDEHSGINFVNYHLKGTDFSLQINDQLYDIANPDVEGGMSAGFRLRPESKKDFHLPFYFTPSSNVAPIQVGDIKNDHVYLVVSLFPNVKQILIEK